MTWSRRPQQRKSRNKGSFLVNGSLDFDVFQEIAVDFLGHLMGVESFFVFIIPLEV